MSSEPDQLVVRPEPENSEAEFGARRHGRRFDPEAALGDHVGPPTLCPRPGRQYITCEKAASGGREEQKDRS
jgi:hypothetical protein